MKYALIKRGLVKEIIEIEPNTPPIEERYAASFVAQCVIAPAEVKQGWLYSNGRFAEPGAVVEPEPVPPEPDPLARTYKTDVWRRCTEVEAGALDAALAASTAKLRRLWDDSTILEHDAPEWPVLVAGVAAVLGNERATEILAPSVL